MFAPVGSGQRRRRGSDGVRLAAAVLILVSWSSGRDLPCSRAAGRSRDIGAQELGPAQTPPAERAGREAGYAARLAARGGVKVTVASRGGLGRGGCRGAGRRRRLSSTG